MWGGDREKTEGQREAESGQRKQERNCGCHATNVCVHVCVHMQIPNAYRGVNIEHHNMPTLVAPTSLISMDLSSWLSVTKEKKSFPDSTASI